ncbi:LysR family transcriptional regulator [Bacillus massiliigorillae]|uniref:LysR family transcriptional regulator n=1 Tax=Bacillus massiliigorillae TaxID=1243664 RepID=UPI00039A6800|nr:LysR family transcriptional regulator [Bacillus massiliigorillae]
MDMKWLKTFIVATKYENFRKASEELYLTQPAVTKHIQRLEHELHIELFNRVGKNISLTPAGYKFLASAVQIMNKYEQEMEEFEGWKQGYNRKLTIAVAPQIAASVLPSFLRNFIDKHSDIEVIINVVSSYKIGEEVSLGRADIGLTRMQPIQTDVSCKTIHRDPVIMVAPNLIGNGQYNEEEMLKQYRLLTNNHPAYWDELLSELKRMYPYVRTLPVTQMEITKRFIEQGLGVSYLPLSMVQEELNNEALVEIKDYQITLPVSFTYIIMKVETSEVKQFVVELNKAFVKE